MEILMKLKCSPAAHVTPQHATLKIVDHHRQLQRQHTLNPPNRTSPYNETNSDGVNLRQHSKQSSRITTSDTGNALHAGYSTAASRNIAEVRRRMGGCGKCKVGLYCGIPSCCLTTPESLAIASDDDDDMQYEYREPEENFISIDDAKIKRFLMKVGQEQQGLQSENTLSPMRSTKATSRPVVYEIIDLDDEDERERLKQIKKQAELKQSLGQPSMNIHLSSRHTKSLDISLIPKSPERMRKTTHEMSRSVSDENQKIIAEIDLLDSSSESSSNDTGQSNCKIEGDNESRENFNDPEDEDDDDDDEELPLVAVSCELKCDDDDDDDGDDDGNVVVKRSTAVSRNEAIVVLTSDEENLELMEEQEESSVGCRCEDLEDEHRGRTFFECFLCGKKVQSSYNLRRHMMIHTGERPFGCDMCDRRFREFSDLKKHRRRHANDKNFVCMVCRKEAPLDNDPTRCSNCCSDPKDGVLIVAMRTPPPPSSPEKQTTITSRRKPSRNLTPVSVVNSSPPPLSQLPPLTSVNSHPASNAQLLLDTIPAVHRPSYNQMGVITRKEFPCPLCQRPFGTRHNLKRHFMIHTGEKPFSCSKCRKPFREYSTLKKHIITHQRDRWYKCLRCPQKYRDYLDYMAHKNSHPKETEMPENTTTHSLRKKQKFISSPPMNSNGNCCDSYDEDSTSEDWIECCECGRRFTDIDTYTEHLKEHDPSSYLFECYICKQNFEERRELELHVRTRHDTNVSICKMRDLTNEGESSN